MWTDARSCAPDRLVLRSGTRRAQSAELLHLGLSPEVVEWLSERPLWITDLIREAHVRLLMQEGDTPDITVEALRSHFDVPPDDSDLSQDEWMEALRTRLGYD